MSRNKYQICKTMTLCKQMVLQTRRITHPHLNELELIAAVTLDLHDINDSIIGNRREYQPTAAEAFQAVLRWANDQIECHCH